MSGPSGHTRRSWRRWTVRVVAGCGGALILAAGGYLVAAATSSDGPTSVPSCSWPLRVRGVGNREQAGLVRCYLRALASRDTNAMLGVADTTHANEPLTITRADFVHAADARSGTATATFRPDDTDGAYVDVSVIFAGGARASVSMALANPASVHSWRMEIGSYPPDQSAPPPAQKSP